MSRRTLLTGATGTIGRAIAESLAVRGDRLALLDLDGAEAARLADALPGEGHVAAGADVTDDQAVADAIARAVDRLAGLDRVVANAGVMSRTPLGQLTPSELRSVLDLNLAGAYRTVAAALPHLRAGSSPTIVLMSSAAGLRGGGITGPAYRLSKAGVIALAQILAADLAAEGIRVNTVAPGGVDGGMSVAFAPAELDAMREHAIGHRLATPREVAAAVAYLLSDEAAYVTGEVLRISGGV